MSQSLERSRLFHVCTVFNRAEDYAEMRASFDRAGFDEGLARFTGFDNTQANEHDPFSVLSQVSTQSTEKYVVLCHQDVRLDRGDGAARLIAQLEELERVDPNWAVAGNAGIDDTARLVGRITDPHQELHSPGLPRRVISLDENLLILRSAARLKCSHGAWGFHFYGTDICFAARLAGFSCYAIDFHLTHLSGGDASTPEYGDALRRLALVWQSRAAIAVARTTTMSWVCASRFALPRFLLERSTSVRLLALRDSLIRPRGGTAAAAAVADWTVANLFALKWTAGSVLGRLGRALAGARRRRVNHHRSSESAEPGPADRPM